ncbi:30S ribosomal protein S9 [Nanoarchaeota archaeon]
MAEAKKTKKKKVKVVKAPVLTIAGKRKTSIAKATIKAGNGKIMINNKHLANFPYLRKLYISEPLRIAEDVLKEEASKFDISVNVKGGGMESQTEAARLAIGRALVGFTKNNTLKEAFVNYDRAILVADVRRKEMRKPGDSKARKRRQTSYR